MEGKSEKQLQMKKSIRYKDVADLGFERRVECDKVFEDIYGVPYIIVTKKLTKTIYIDWNQIERTCEMYRIDNKRDCNVVGRMPIQGLDHLKAMIKFFEK